jgi:hypothetical protein
VRRLDQVVVAADGERLRVAERLLEPRGELVHAHGNDFRWAVRSAADAGKMRPARPNSTAAGSIQIRLAMRPVAPSRR